MHIILTHENADFDAIASLLGAHKLYPNAKPVLPVHINRNVQAYLDLYGAELPFVNRKIIPRGRRVKRVILVDTQSLTTIRGMGKTTRDVLIIDHHTPPTDLPEGWRFQGEMLGAATTLLVEALSTRLIPISRIEATLLLTGIYEDTGALTYGATSPRDLRAAAWLMDQGASLAIATEFLEHPLTNAQQSIYNALREHAETLEFNGHPVVISWAQSPPHTQEEISTLIHKLRDLLNAVAGDAPSAILIMVQLGDHVQLIARSTTADINVARVAQHFGGDGHDRAAAALIRDANATTVFAELRELLPTFVQPRIQVRDLMSHGVRTVQPQDPIAMVSKQMLHTGHEGFPVVGPAGRVMGLVTRNAVDRALQHRWERQPVHRIMQAGEITLAPEDSADRVRTLMIRSGWGQIPVVVGHRVVGVVTRTDMIRMPPSARESARQDITRRMEQAFPAELLTLIHQIGNTAADLGYTIYFVGGIVRDLLLGQAIVDIDLVVEGDAITLGKTLAREFGGEVHSHNRFGTIKWTIPKRQKARSKKQKARSLHPASLDLVTARTEFYERPTALPMVERSSIKQDLHRRDFTINTLAIRLDPQRWGELLDFYGGQADLEAGVIRVLHSLSFVDDPTRILRAARFEARLGFQLDPRSERLIADALPLLDRMTGGRIRHELDLIFKENQPEAALHRLQNIGALQQIHPQHVSDDWLHVRFARLREAETLAWWNINQDKQRLFLHWALFLYRLPIDAINYLIKRLLLPGTIGTGARLLPALAQNLAVLDTLAQPSAITQHLDTLPLNVQAVAWLATDDLTLRERLAHYARAWRHIKPALTGKDLKALGIPPGPIYRDIFTAIRAAKLDGILHNVTEELSLAQTYQYNT